MFQVRRVGDQPLDLLSTQHGRQGARLPRRRNGTRHAVALQRLVVEEAQPTHDDVAGTPRPVPIANQVEDVGLNLLVGDPVRRPMVERRETADRPQVRFPRPIGEASNDHGLIHATSSLRHATPPPIRGERRAQPGRYEKCLSENAGRCQASETGPTAQRFRSTPAAHPRLANNSPSRRVQPLVGLPVRV